MEPGAMKFRSIHEWDEMLDATLLQNAERHASWCTKWPQQAAVLDALRIFTGILVFPLPFISTVFTLAYILSLRQFFVIDVALLRTYLYEITLIN
jgi:hypothetical protein